MKEVCCLLHIEIWLNNCFRTHLRVWIVHECAGIPGQHIARDLRRCTTGWFLSIVEVLMETLLDLNRFGTTFIYLVFEVLVDRHAMHTQKGKIGKN